MASVYDCAVARNLGVGVQRHAVAGEQFRQIELWGVQVHEPEVWLAILMEEVGEAAQAALNSRFEHGTAEELRKEVVQIAAVAMSWLDAMAREQKAKEGGTG